MGKNYYLSSITAPYGVFSGVPGIIITEERVDIHFTKENLNTLLVKFIFENSDFSREVAQVYADTNTRLIALKLSLENTLSFKWNSNISSSWELKGTDNGTTKTVSHSVQAHISGAIKVKIRPDDLKFSYRKIDNNGLIDALEFFNTALKHKESPNSDREVALWLQMCWEVIQLAYGLTEQELRKYILEKQILSKSELSALEYSTGEYYRHVKRKQTDHSSPLIPITDCLKIMQKLLMKLSTDGIA